jgi:hydroxyacylglutathione hydrolase
MTLEIVTIPCLQDNYAYLIKGPSAVTLIDAPDAAPILAELTTRGWTLDRILITHHHWDHVDGLADIKAATGAQSYGPRAEADKLPALDHLIDAGTQLGEGPDGCRVLAAPGHTLGHVAYYFAAAPALFCADSLMVMGCGRLFEGTADQMHDTISAFAALPDETLVCSGHEYTASNVKFALSIDPDNAQLQTRAADVTRARAEGRATVPALLSLEKATNPFMRAHDPALRQRLGMEDATDAQVFAKIRQLKDEF